METVDATYSNVSHRKFRVYQLDSHSFDCKLLFESPIMPRNSNIDKYMTIHNEYLLVNYSTGPGFIVMNWRDGIYFRVEGKVGEKVFNVCLPRNASSDIQFFTEYCEYRVDPRLLASCSP